MPTDKPVSDYDALPDTERARVDSAVAYVVGHIRGNFVFNRIAGPAVSSTAKLCATHSLTRRLLGIVMVRALTELGLKVD